MLLNSAVEDFLVSHSGSLATTTITNYRYALAPLVSMFGDRDVESLTRYDLRQWRNSFSGVSPATANTRIRVARRLFNWLADDLDAAGVVFKNPARGLARFREEIEPKAISDETVAAMLLQARRDGNQRDAAIVLFLYSTGGRVGGLINLRLADLRLDEGWAMVREKGDKKHKVYLDPLAAESLQTYITYARPSVSDHVFLSIRRKALTRQGVWYALRALAGRAGVPADAHTNPHSFRHAFAIAYLRNGGDLSSLRALLHHSTIAITDAYYARWSADQLQEQHQRFNPVNRLKNQK